MKIMKKNIFFAMMVAMVGLVLASCSNSKDSEGLSRFTYYPVLELEGDASMVVAKGSTFQDPGFKATLNGEDVSNQVVVNSNVNTAASGVYSVVYSIKNSDGITANAKRTVIVLDLNDPIEGFYLTQADSYRVREGAQVAYGNVFEILIIGNGDGTYDVDDLLGGWYCQRAGYGTNYALGGTIAIAEDGTVTCLKNYIPGWGNGLDSFEGTYNAATSTFNVKSVYAEMDFVQTWVKE
jgi:hypothetical protein